MSSASGQAILPLDRALSRHDLDHLMAHTGTIWEALRGKRIFITGGTGFVGTWLVETFLHANAYYALQASITVLSRNPAGFRERSSHLANHPAVQLHEGNATDFTFPEGEFSHVIHAATETVSGAHPADPLAHFDANVQGTRRVLEFAQRCGAEQFLFTSSGAVYGKQPPELPLVPESFAGAPLATDLASAYGQSKRVSEFLCAATAKQSGISIPIARLFAFIGPRLPLQANYAAGNFMGNALRGEPIQIAGDGTPLRSYLYAADLAVWLWTILLRGESGRVYNVGSDQPISILELAAKTAQIVAPGSKIAVASKPDPSHPPTRYVPDINRARTELGLQVRLSLEEGISRMARWHRQAIAPLS